MNPPRFPPPADVLKRTWSLTPTVLDSARHSYGWRCLDSGISDDLSGVSGIDIPYRLHTGPIIFEGEDPAEVVEMALVFIEGVWHLFSRAALNLWERVKGTVAHVVRWLCPTCFDRADHARPAVPTALSSIPPVLSARSYEPMGDGASYWERYRRSPGYDGVS